jgi:hypothetical protein
MGSKFRTQLDQRFLFQLRQARAEVGFVPGRDLLNLFQKPIPFWCQVQVLASSILRAALTREQPFLLKLIEQHHQAAGQNAEMRGEFTLIVARVGVDPAQDADMRRSYAKACDLAAKGKRRMRPDLRQQQTKRPLPGWRFFEGLLFLSWHTSPFMNIILLEYDSRSESFIDRI